jgi:hypothetical protein
MTEKYAHLAPDHLRTEIAWTERQPAAAALNAVKPHVVEPVAGTIDAAGDEDPTQVVDFTSRRRGSSEAEQLIRNQ